MIRYSDNNDREGIISLWNEAFGDKRDEIEFFLNKKYIPENTIVKEINGETASMLFLLEGKMHIDHTDYPAYYLYAACTAKKHRGKGYMSKLLDFAKQTAADRGVEFICLLPAEKSLYDYYSVHGYKTVFKRKTVTLNADELNKICQTASKSSDFSFKPIDKLRDEVLEDIDYFKWDRLSIEFAANYTKLYGGSANFSNKGYFLYSISDGSLTVKEIIFTSEIDFQIINNIVKQSNLTQIRFFVPASFDFPVGQAEITDSGMLLPITKNAQKIADKIENAYLGLTLD